MTPKKQRMAIAEVCPLLWSDKGFIWSKQGYLVHPFDKITIDPLNDLNAMMEAFSRLGRHWQIEQVEDGFVCTIQFGPRNKDVVVGGLDLCPVLAEAFLCTLNKWEN